MKRSRRGPSGPPRRRLVPICVAGVLLAILFCAAAPAGAAAPALCVEDYARDYGARLGEMPRQDPPPEGELPFGPRNFSMYRPEMTPVVLEGSNLGYRFAAKNGEGRTFHLGWTLRAVLNSVDSDGRFKRVVAKKRRRVDVVDDLDQLALTFPAKHSGHYRTDVRIRDLDSGRSVSYREHWRVLERSVDIDLTVSAESLHRGESVYGLVQNPGASRIFAPGYLDLQRWEGGGWVEVPQPLTPAAVMRGDWWIEPGENAPCHRYDVPAAATPGLYRFVAAPYAVELQRRVTVTRSFAVAP